MGLHVVYGIGGHDPSKPNNNVISEQVEDLADEAAIDTTALAAALANLPADKLEALLQALGQNTQSSEVY